MTIIAEIFKLKRVRQATDLYINFDGATDNICYKVFYGIAWLLRCAKKAGWPLQRIHILRFKVHACFVSVCVHVLCTNIIISLCA